MTDAAVVACVKAADLEDQAVLNSLGSAITEYLIEAAHRLAVAKRGEELLVVLFWAAPIPPDESVN
jgi:hypothetical protein